jgi:hypothetical protein
MEDTKTFWRYENLLDPRSRSRRYENLLDPKDTKTFWILAGETFRRPSTNHLSPPKKKDYDNGLAPPSAATHTHTEYC